MRLRVGDLSRTGRLTPRIKNHGVSILPGLFGEEFTADVDLAGEDKFGSKTFIHFFDDQNGGLLQSLEYHTSCSQPIQLWDIIGNAELVGYVGEDGSFI